MLAAHDMIRFFFVCLFLLNLILSRDKARNTATDKNHMTNESIRLERTDNRSACKIAMIYYFNADFININIVYELIFHRCNTLCASTGTANGQRINENQHCCCLWSRGRLAFRYTFFSVFSTMMNGTRQRANYRFADSLFLQFVFRLHTPSGIKVENGEKVCQIILLRNDK